MTVQSALRSAGPYVGTGSAASLPFAFKVFTAADLLVTRANVALSLGGDYTVTLNSDQDNNPGGTVNITAAANTSGAKVYVESQIAETQGSSIPNKGGFFPKVIEGALDKITILVQQLRGTVSRAVLLPRDTTTWNGKYIAVDAGGVPYAASGTGNDSALRTDLANSTFGALLIAWKANGTGAAARTLWAKLWDLPVSPKDFGAAVDGTTDDTLAFQATINTGLNIALPRGVMVSGPVTLANNDQRIDGSRGCTIKRKNATTGNLITVTGASCTLSGFKIDGNSANQTYAYNVREVYVTGVSCEVRGLRISSAQSHGIGATQGAVSLTICDNEIQTVGDFGIFVDGNSGSGADPAYGLCENNTVVEFGSQGNGGATTSVGIGIRSALGGWRIANNIVRQITPRTNDQLGIECWTNSNNVVVQGNVVDMSTANSGEFGLSVTGYGSLVTGNLVLGTTKYGIELIDRAVVCTGNILRSPAGTGIAVNLNSGHTDPGDVITITGNTIENTSSLSGSFGGIYVSGVAGVTPIAITIASNTIHGLSNGVVVTNLVVGYTITGNTIYNTGSNMTGIAALGSDGTVIGNVLYRVPAVGTGNGGQITLDGSGHIVALNRISGNGRMDNGVLINSTATNALIAMNMVTGVTGNSVFSNSSDPTIVVMGGMGSVGLALNAANYAEGFFNTTNKATISQGVTTNLGSFTVANLPSVGVTAGTLAYASNGRKNGEGAGLGTGVQVFRDGTAWRAVDTGATVAA